MKGLSAFDLAKPNVSLCETEPLSDKWTSALSLC